MLHIMDSHLPESTRPRAPSHQDYLDSLQTPSLDQRRRISDVQIQKEREISEKYNNPEGQDAARTIQRAYRGHRERRQLAGLTLDPSSRWLELIREWKYRSAIAPHRRLSSSGSQHEIQTPSDVARANWRRAGEIAEHAVAADAPAGDSVRRDSSSSSPVQKSKQNLKTPGTMMLDLRYFLEMVDVKHRYGANLQVYHEEWQRSDTDQNFFLWLDHGAGRHLDLPGCSRAKLEKERIRYLTKEERMNYLVCVDEHGLLRWARNEELITTSVDHYQDSSNGIIPKGTADPTHEDNTLERNHSADVTLTTKAAALGGLIRDSMLADSASLYASSTTSSSTSTSSGGPETDPLQATQNKPKKSHRRLFVSPATILNHLLRASVRPGTWIYVADTVGRLYVGIKSSGAFQHASFLSGARISSAGIIGIENGKLIYLSPLSGHYRPTTKSFKAFIDSLRTQGVDLSKLKVSKAYAVLLGMEVYAKSKKDLKKVMHPQDEARREERRRRKASKASAVAEERAAVAETLSATELIERKWDDEHERRGLNRLRSDSKQTDMS